MKNIFCAIVVCFGISFLSYAEGIAEEAKKGRERTELSYAFGMLVGEDLRDAGFEFNYDAFLRGFRDTMENKDTMYSVEEAVKRIEGAFNARQAEISERNLAESNAFLAENGQRSEVITTPSGLQFEPVSEGSGEMPAIADTVQVHYQGTLANGTIFDSSYSYGEPIEIPLDRVISGWSEGLRMMREGGKAKLYIPPSLAYGEYGAGVIGPNAVLIFDVELIKIIRDGTDD